MGTSTATTSLPPPARTVTQTISNKDGEHRGKQQDNFGMQKNGKKLLIAM